MDQDSTTSTRATITTSSRLMVNTVLNLLNQAITVFINFAMIGFFLDTLGEDGYGVWILVGSIFSYRNLMSMGLNSAVNRNIPVHLARGDGDAIRTVVSTAFAYYLAPASLLVVGTLALYFHFDTWFSVDPNLVSSARNVTLVVGLSFALTLPLQVYNAVLSSFQRYDLMNIISVSAIVIRTLLVILFLSSGYGLVALATLYAVAEIGIRLLSVFFAHRLMADFNLSHNHFDRRLLGSMLTYGVSTIFYMSGAVLVYKSAELVIGALISTAAVSRFFIATTPVMLLTTVVQVFAQAMKPAVSELDALEEHSRIEEIALLSQKYTLLAILPGLAFLLLLGNDFLNVWVGDRFSDAAVIRELDVVMNVLAVGACARLAQHTNFIVLVGKGQHRAFGAAAGITLLVCVASEIAAVSVFDAGLIGVAMGCAAPMAAISVFFLPAYFNRQMGIRLRHTLTRSWLPAALASAPSIALLVFWSRVSSPSSWLELLGGVALTAFTSAVATWVFALGERERERLGRVARFRT